MRRVFTEPCKKCLGMKEPEFTIDENVPARPPVMCAGCPHRGIFYILKKKIMVYGDIGCYTLVRCTT